MPTLKAPPRVVLLVSLIIAIVAWIAFSVDIKYIGQHPSILLTVAYVVPAVAASRDYR